MNATTDLERTLAIWLEHEGPDDVPERVVEAALAEARAVHQRPAWLTATWWASLASREGKAMRPTQTIDRVPTLPVVRSPLRLGWIAVAILAVLALLGGLLVAGALQNRTAPLLSECPAGTTPNEPGPVDQERPARAAWAINPDGVWDGERSVIFLADGWTWRFDLCTNTWSRRAVPGAMAGGSAVVYDVDSRLVVSFGSSLGGPDRSVSAYDSKLDRTVTKGSAPTAYILAAYDPVTGQIVVMNLASTVRGDPRVDVGVWTYDVDADTWAEVPTSGPAPGYSRVGSLLQYDPAVDRFVVYQLGNDVVINDPGQSASTWELDLRHGRWTKVDADAPIVSPGLFGFSAASVYDEANSRMIVYSDGVVGAYDAARDEWERAYDRPFSRGLSNRLSFGLGYDPLNHRMVVFGGQQRTQASGDGGWRQKDDVVAFDLRNRAWIELLAPSE